MPTQPETPYDDDKAGYPDEKKGSSVDVVHAIVGDVYEDIRVIDLGEDGKERPIGTYPFGCLRKRKSNTALF